MRKKEMTQPIPINEGRPRQRQWLCNISEEFLADYRRETPIPLTPRLLEIIGAEMAGLDTINSRMHGAEVPWVIVLRKKGVFGTTKTENVRFSHYEAGPVYRDEKGELEILASPIFVRRGAVTWADRKKTPGDVPVSHDEMPAGYIAGMDKTVKTGIRLFPLQPVEAAWVGVPVNDPDHPTTQVYWGTLDDMGEVVERLR